MRPRSRRSGISRRSILTTVAALPMLSLPHVRTGWAQSIDPLPSWNKGVAKETIIGFVQAAVDGSGRSFVPQEARIATFDQDGTLWVEHLMYTQVTYCLDRVPTLVWAAPTISSTCTPDPEQSFPDPSRAERVGTVECSGSASNLLGSYPQGRTGRPRSQQEGPVR